MVGLDALGVGGCALVNQVMLLAVGRWVDGYSYSALGYRCCHICVLVNGIDVVPTIMPSLRVTSERWVLMTSLAREAHLMILQLGAAMLNGSSHTL